MEVYAINLVCNGSGVMFLFTNSISLIMTSSILIIVKCLRGKMKHSYKKHKLQCDESQSSYCISIYWCDVSGQKQKEIEEVFGDNNNYDVFPIAVIQIPETESTQ